MGNIKLTKLQEGSKCIREKYIINYFSGKKHLIKKLFDDLSDLNYIFLQLQLTYQTSLKERKIRMYPMDYEEFRWALGDEVSVDMLRQFYESKKPLGQAAIHF